MLRRPRRTAASKAEAVIMIEDTFSILRSDILKGERDFATSQEKLRNSTLLLFIPGSFSINGSKLAYRR